MSRHLLVVLSGHGYGHVAQAGPVVNALRRQLPDLKLTLYTAAPASILASRFFPPFEHLERAADVGAVMDSAFTVRAQDTARAYAEFHRHWSAAVDEETARLRQLAPDLVLADVPYRVLTAARRLNIPALALCSLNWAAIYRHYCGAHPEAATIHEQIVTAYDDADAFLCPAPSMAMPELRAVHPIGPIAWPARPDPDHLRRRLGLSRDQRVVLAALGGVPTRLAVQHWPRHAGTVFLVPAAWQARDPGFVTIESLDMHFSDVLASCDAVLTKPGYNTLVEAACQGVAVLYAAREDWPEEPPLLDWLERHARARRLSQRQLDHGDFSQDLDRLFAQPSPPRPQPTGVAEAVELLAERLL